jgi:hypothetical protein
MAANPSAAAKTAKIAMVIKEFLTAMWKESPVTA